MFYDFDCAGGRVGIDRSAMWAVAKGTAVFGMLPDQKSTLSERRISARRERFI